VKWGEAVSEIDRDVCVEECGEVGAWNVSLGRKLEQAHEEVGLNTVDVHLCSVDCIAVDELYRFDTSSSDVSYLWPHHVQHVPQVFLFVPVSIFISSSPVAEAEMSST